MRCFHWFSIQISGTLKIPDIRFMTKSKSAFQLNDASIVLFSYQTHFELEIWMYADDRRSVGKWFFSTNVLMENFVHFSINPIIW